MENCNNLHVCKGFFKLRGGGGNCLIFNSLKYLGRIRRIYFNRACFVIGSC